MPEQSIDGRDLRDKLAALFARSRDQGGVVALGRGIIFPDGVKQVAQMAADRPYFIVSANQPTFTAQENAAQNRLLVGEIKQLGLKAYQLIAALPTGDDGKEISASFATAFFVSWRGSCITIHELKNFLCKLIHLKAKYHQNLVLFGLPTAFNYGNWLPKNDEFQPGGQYIIAKGGMIDRVSATSNTQLIDRYFSGAVLTVHSSHDDWTFIGTLSAGSWGIAVYLDNLGLALCKVREPTLNLD